jgi:hypothetical protein
MMGLSTPAIPRQSYSRLDLIGAVASSVCAAHCAVVPLAIALFPLAGLDALESHAFDYLFACAALGLGALAVVRGFLRHRRVAVAVWFGLSALLLTVGLTVLHDGVAHVATLVAGGLALAWTHLLNLRLLHRCEVHSDAAATSAAGAGAPA